MCREFDFMKVTMRESTSATARPVKGMVRPIPAASSASILYSVPAVRTLQYTNLAGIFSFWQVCASFVRTCFVTAVFPVPVFPYTRRFDGLEEWSIGDSTCARDVSCGVLNGRCSGT